MSQVRDEWKPWEVVDLGQRLRERNTEFVEAADSAVQSIRSAGSEWSGDSYLAAYDRIAGDRDLGVRAAGAVDGLAQQLIDGGGSLTSYRQVLLRRVDDAVEAGANISEDWSVTGTDLAAGDLEFHRSGISTGLADLLTSRSTVSEGASTLVSEIQTQAATLTVGGGDASSGSSALLNGQAIDPDTVAAGSLGAISSSALQGTPTNTQNLATAQQPGQTAVAPTVSGTLISADAGKSVKATDDGASKPADTGGGSGKPADTGAGSGKGTDTGASKGAGGNSTSGGSSSSAFDPSTWTTSDLVSVLGAVKGFTGDLPSLVTSLSGLDDDLDDIIKASADAAVKLGFVDGTTDSRSATDKPTDTSAGDKPASDKPGAAKLVSDALANGTPISGATGSEGSGSQSGGASTEPRNDAAADGSGPTKTDNGNRLTAQSGNSGSSQTATTGSLVGLPSIGRRSKDDSRQTAPSIIASPADEENSSFANDEFWASSR
ncbi:hypothetical protein [Nocardia sp. NPDC058633]|uniref:hypothetical protein n=1 Tax=Nocardia sp. NPDC058633 TaxID=3346568 RepID=UPI003650FBEF